MLFRFSLLLGTAVLSVLALQPPRGPEPKVFQWVDQRAGDCHLSGTLSIYPDGRAHWDATTWTDKTHNKDYWHETLRVFDGRRQQLFGFGVWNSPPMDSPPNGGQYNWSAEGNFPRNFFDAVSTAISEGSC